MADAEECGTCKFWGAPHGGTLAKCRRHAPVAVESDRYRGQVSTCWPMTPWDGWCGDWEPRVPEDDGEGEGEGEQ